MTEEHAQLILINILDGYLDLLGKKIMHRDLKPANILIHNNVYKIGDLSWSCYFEDNNYEDSGFKKIIFFMFYIGTPRYSSP